MKARNLSSRISSLAALSLLPLISAGCMASMLAGEAVRSGQRDTDAVLGAGVTPAMLGQKKNMAINVNGMSSQGQIILASGQGSTNINVYNDMLTKEFLKAGYKARAVPGNVSESSPPAELKRLAAQGFDIVLVGSMNLSSTTSYMSAMTGGDAMNTGVTSFTVKGLDPRNGSVLFILSTEYGKAKKVSEVAIDLSQQYHALVRGELTVADES